MAVLGRKQHTAGNTIRYAVDYSLWLDDGDTITGGVVTKDAASAAITDMTIGAVTVTPSQHLVFTVQGGSVNETLTIDVQATNSRGEVKKDTAILTVVAA